MIEQPSLYAPWEGGGIRRGESHTARPPRSKKGLWSTWKRDPSPPLLCTCEIWPRQRLMERRRGRLAGLNARSFCAAFLDSPFPWDFGRRSEKLIRKRTNIKQGHFWQWGIGARRARQELMSSGDEDARTEFPFHIRVQRRGICARLRLRSCISHPCWLEIRARNEEKDALFPPPQGQKAKANFLPNLTFFVRKMARLVLSSFQRAITILLSLAEVNFLGGGECALINGTLISPPILCVPISRNSPTSCTARVLKYHPAS